MEVAVAMAIPTLTLSAAASSSCASSSTCRSLNLSQGPRWRRLESSSSSHFMPAGSSLLQEFKFVENSRRDRTRVWSLQVRCDAGVSVVKELVGEDEGRRIVQDFTTVMKFGGSSVASAHRMKEVAQLILSFPEEKPIIVLSAMGKTTNNLLKVCMCCGVLLCRVQEATSDVVENCTSFQCAVSRKLRANNRDLMKLVFGWF